METAARRIPLTLAIAITILLAILAGTFGSAPLGPADAHEVRALTLPVHADWVNRVRWTDTWGAPRSGGRSHLGVDMLSDEKMIPLVAARSGEITWGRFDNRGGSILRFRDDEGWEYQYIHLNNDTPGTDDGNASCSQVFSARICDGIDRRGNLQSGLRLAEGEVIAFLGDSGNAEWTSPHLHFEIYKPTGSGTEAINPTPSVDAALARIRDGSAGPVEVAAPEPLPEPEPRPAPAWAAPGDDGFADYLWYQLEGRYPTPAESSAFSAAEADDGSWSALAQRLDDGSAAVSIDRLYQAFFLRYPDADGLRYWIGQRASGYQLEEIAEWFARSDELQLRVGNADPGQLVDQLYRDVLGREPDPTGRRYWLDELDGGRATKGSIVVYFSESDEMRTLMRDRNELVTLSLVHGGTAPTAAEATKWTSLRSTASLPEALAAWYGS